MPQALLLMTEPGGIQRPVWVSIRPVTLGRDARNEVVVDDPSVSRCHLRLRLHGTYVAFEDLDSSSGTFLNGYQVTTGELALGGEILIGQTRLEFVSLEGPEEASGISPLPPVVVEPCEPAEVLPPVFRPRPAPLPERLPVPQPGFSAGPAPLPQPLPVKPSAVPGTRSAITAFDFRHPWEIPVFILLCFILVGVLVVAGVVWIILAIFTLGTSLLWIPIAMLWSLGMVIAVIYQYYSVRSRYPQVSEAAYPQIHAAVVAAARRLNMAAPPVFIATDESEINAWATSLFRPLVVLNRGLIEAMDTACVQFVLGHEFGHIKLWHTPLGVLLHNEMAHGFIGQVLFLPGLILRLLFLGWDRLAEHSADRAGLLACGSLGTSVHALLLLRYGPGQVSQADLQRHVDALRAQGGGAEEWRAIASTHPTVRRRVNDLIGFRRSPQGVRAASKLSMSAQTGIS